MTCSPVCIAIQPDRILDPCQHLNSSAGAECEGSGCDRWLAIEDAISEQGWTLVLLLRAAPFVPCCVLNYTLALTSVRWSTYALTVHVDCCHAACPQPTCASRDARC